MKRMDTEAFAPSAPARPLVEAAPAEAAPAGGCEIVYLVKRLQHRVRQAIERTLVAGGVGIGFATLTALSALRARPERSGAQLARDCFVSAQSMNHLLRQLEAERWVARVPHPENARIELWSVTRRGYDLLARGEAALGALDDHLRSALEPREQRQFQRSIGKLAASLDQWDANLGARRSRDDDA